VYPVKIAECDDNVLVVENIVKKFKKGPRIGPINFQLKRSEIFALIGPNGSGKTTTLRMILGIYKPDSGHVLLCGEDITGKGARGQIAYVPEESAIYPRLTGFEHLLFYARLYARSEAEAEKLAWRAADISGLGKDLYRKAGEYSKGMKRKLVVSLALALDTPLLVLDEPTAGLDVYSAVTIRGFIKHAAKRNQTILMTSHNMLEVEKLADRVAFIANGRILDIGKPKELVEKYGADTLEDAFVKAVRGGIST